MGSFLIRIYLYSFFDEFIFIYPLYAVMFVDYGVGPLEVSALFITWSVTAFVCEVPSGVLADKYSRKYLLVIGQGIRMLGYGCWLLFPSFWGFWAGFVLWGIKGALASGTFEALVYDELKRLGREGEFTRAIGRIHSVELVAILLASGGASLAIVRGYDFVLVLSEGALVLSSLALFLLPSMPAVESTGEKTYWTLFKKGVGDAVGDRVVFRLILFMALSMALGGGLDEYWPIFAQEAGLPKYALGVFLGIMSGAQALAGVVAYRFAGFSNGVFYGMLVGNGLLLVAAGILMRPASVVLLVVFSFWIKILDVVFEGKLQHAIASDMRATISSVRGFLLEVVAVAVYAVMGAMAEKYSYQAGFVFFGGVTVALGCVYLMGMVRREIR